MNMKNLITVSIFSLISVSGTHAADIMITRQSTEIAPPVVVAPSFSWTGFYLGGQIGSFSSKTDMSIIQNGKINQIKKSDLPKLSGFVGGVYAGSNIDLGNNFVLGIDTDMIWSDKKDIKVSQKFDVTDANKGDVEKILSGANIKIDDNTVQKGDAVIINTLFKEKWSGATRVRLGFAVDRMMPYIAGGIAYAQFQDVVPITLREKAKNTVIVSGNVLDETKTMVGYTFGAGVDFAMTDSVILRAEYRYSDFGKKKFGRDTRNIEYKTNNFRFGVAYKF
ncbi:outer membrane protein [Bartonella sp. F02]|uniref:outer membrane protein n=1 Tax=Bartonella sp. F02 TaxID=2967262 RepID=UPI0022A95A4F|nr:outer membrane protein [Bartonella sp. F02]MCZ2328090.1 porin family protein [Bartonella sp. F02]